MDLALRFCLAIARISYALVVLIVTVAAARLAVWALTGASGPTSVRFAAAILIVMFLGLSCTAIARRLRGRPLIPRPANHAQSARVLFMTLAGGFAHFLVFNVCLAIYQIRHALPDRDVEGGPLVFLSAIAGAGYLAALLTGELGSPHPATSAANQSIQRPGR